MRTGLRLCFVALVLTVGSLLGTSGVVAQPSGLTLIGHSDLGGAGLNGPVATVGSTAVVAAGIAPGAGIHTHFYNPYPCPAVAVKVVDLSHPARPRVASTIPVPEGVAALDVAALRVETPAFTGDLAAVALARCGAAGNTVDRGVVYYDVSDPATPVFLGRYYADVDSAGVTGLKTCGPEPDGDPARCASSQHSVALVQRADGRVLSLSTEPGASASNFPSGDLRIVDVTDPRTPEEVGSLPRPGEPIFSFNGCRAFIGGHDAAASADGTLGLLAHFDGGLMTIDLTDPAAPAELARLGYGEAREVEGNAAYVTVAEVDDRRLALVSEEDWIGVSSHLRVDGPDGASYPGCPAIFTLFAPGDSLQVYRRPDAEVAAEIVYVGRGCPANEGWGTTDPDPYLSDARGIIALIDRQRQLTQPDISEGSGCSLVERAKRAQGEGAVGVVLMQTSATAPEAFSPDGDTDYVLLPLMMIDRPTGDSLRTRLCPRVDGDGRCAGGDPLRGAMADAPGAWGGLRIIDITDPAAPFEVDTYRTPSATAFPPPDLGVYAPGQSVARDGKAYVAWHSDGLRVFGLAGDGGEEARFVPADRVDPTGTLPSKSYVVGVDLLESDGAADPTLVVITDTHSGLYILSHDAP